LLFGAVPLYTSDRPGDLAFRLEGWIVGSFGASAVMLLGCIITAFFVPNMLRKGTVDLLLAEPVNRFTLLAYKYVGGLTFMFLNTVVLVVGIWAAIGARTGIWDAWFLFMIPVLTFEFAVFYALSTLAAVWTRSPVVSILLCVLMWGVLMGLGWVYWLANYH